MKYLSLTLLNGQKTDPFPRHDRKYPFKVAIVDDDENDLRMIRQAVEKTAEFLCVGAYRSANAALADIPKILPHVVLMDIRLPGMDGHECARRLKVIMVQLRIIIVTGLLDIDTVNKSLQAGVDGYLTKPVGIAQFLAVLKLTVRRKAMPSGIERITGQRSSRCRSTKKQLAADLPRKSNHGIVGERIS